MKRRQHEPLRIPDRWNGQDRSLVMQLDRVLDEIYVLISKLEERTQTLKSESEALAERVEALEEQEE